MTTLREPGTFQHEAGAKICIPAVEARGQQASRSAALCREGKEPKHSSEKLANGRTERLAELLHAALQKALGTQHAPQRKRPVSKTGNWQNPRCKAQDMLNKLRYEEVITGKNSR